MEKSLEEEGFACRIHSAGTLVADLKILTKVMGLEETTTAWGLRPEKSYGDTWDNRGRLVGLGQGGCSRDTSRAALELGSGCVQST